MRSCRDTSALISRSLDERLSRTERLGVRLHLLMCSACRNFERQVLFLRKACALLAAEVPPAERRGGPPDPA